MSLLFYMEDCIYYDFLLTKKKKCFISKKTVTCKNIQLYKIYIEYQGNSYGYHVLPFVTYNTCRLCALYINVQVLCKLRDNYKYR